MEQRVNAQPGDNLRAVMAALERLNATDASRAVTARKLAAADETLEELGTNGVSNTLSYLNLQRHVLGRNWDGAMYAYWIMRPLDSKGPAEKREPAPRKKPVAEQFKVAITGPGMLVEREVDADMAARIAAMLLQKGVAS
jgi:hypothetical protein